MTGIPGCPLPADLHAVLGAREAALKKRADRQAEQLRDVIGTFGFVVREDGTRQFWRPLVRS
ncbi:MAG: hypothetical protein HKP61_10605 [Dactylosporangium sp.]|nr:hypothetical protein [Dactylosporangium sp.]NNJ61379.1 hypothetical protein [Dactylosporangium sp.]